MTFEIGIILSNIPYVAFAVAMLGLYKNPSKWRMYASLVTVFISVMAYSFSAKSAMDLTRYHEYLQNYTGSVIKLLENVNDGLYLRTVLFWLVEKTGDKNILQMVTTGIVYGVGIYITCDASERFNNKAAMLPMIVLQMLFFPFVSVVSNVRNVSAFSLIVLAAYKELVQHRRGIITVALYILPCMLHTSALMLVLLRLVISVSMKHKMLIMGIASISPFLIGVLYNYIGIFSFLPALSRLIVKMYDYMYGVEASSGWAVMVANSPWQRVYKLWFLLYIALFAIYIYLCTKSKKLTPEGERICAYGFVLCAFTLACSFFSTPQYWRFGISVTILQGAIIVILQGVARKGRMRYLYLLLWILGCGCEVLNLYALPSQVFFEKWISQIVITNPILVLFNAIKNIF